MDLTKYLSYIGLSHIKSHTPPPIKRHPLDTTSQNTASTYAGPTIAHPCNLDFAKVGQVGLEMRRLYHTGATDFQNPSHM